jgi:hypothetical protein
MSQLYARRYLALLLLGWLLVPVLNTSVGASTIAIDQRRSDVGVAIEAAWSFEHFDLPIGTRIILAGLDNVDDSVPDGLALVALLQEKTWFGLRWELQLESNDESVSGTSGVQSASPMTLLNSLDLFSLGKKYRVTLGYRPDTGEIAMSLHNETDNTKLFEGFTYGEKDHHFTHAGTGWVPSQTVTQNFRLGILSQVTDFQRVGHAISLSDIRREVTNARWADEQVRLSLKRSAGWLPGELVATVIEPVAMQGVELFRIPASAGEISSSLAVKALDPGQYAAELTYVEEGYKESLGRYVWKVIAPEVDGDIIMSLPVAAWKDTISDQHLGKAVFTSTQPIEDVSVTIYTDDGEIVFEKRLQVLPEGSTALSFAISATQEVPKNLMLEVKANNSPIKSFEKQWQSLTIGLRSAGIDDTVLQNTLLEMSIGSDAVSQSNVTVTAQFIAPSGRTVEINAKPVYRPVTKANWVARIAPDEPGIWQYQVVMSDKSSAKVSLEQGSFTVKALPASTVFPPAERPRAPFRVLYNNDLTNVLFDHPQYDVGTLVERSVDEVANTSVEVHVLSPSFTWVPWWRSNFYPMEEHIDWFRNIFPQVYGTEPLAEYLLQGGDPIQVFIDHARERGQVPFLTFRLNDQHYLEEEDERDVELRGMRHWSRFYYENPEYRIGANQTNSKQRVLNWTIPEVRGHILGLIYEAVAMYNMEGIELDFLRHASFFPEGTPLAERQQIMTDFIRQVRQILDANTAPGEYRWLSIRVPLYLTGYETVGVDLKAAVDAGVDMVVLTTSHDMHQQGDYQIIRQMLPDTQLYLEIAYTSSLVQRRPELWPDERRQKSSDQQMYTTAYLAYSAGLDGVNVFNFAYYRNPTPFHVLEHLDDPQWLAQTGQQYYIERTAGPDYLGWVGISRTHYVNRNRPVEFSLRMVPPTGGWTDDGKLRIHITPFEKGRKWRATLNGVVLDQIEDVSPPYPYPYPEAYGTPDEYVAWRVPADVPQEGDNIIRIELLQGWQAQINYLDLGIQ